MNSRIMIALLFFSIPFMLLSCKSGEEKDAEAKDKVEALLPAGVTVEVNEGVAILKGSFPDEASRMAAEASARTVAGVDSVSNQAAVTPPPAPTQVSPDQQLRTEVMAAISNYPEVRVSVTGGVITLTGRAKQSDLPGLMQSIYALNPASVDNQIVIY